MDDHIEKLRTALRNSKAEITTLRAANEAAQTDVTAAKSDVANWQARCTKVMEALKAAKKLLQERQNTAGTADTASEVAARDSRIADLEAALARASA